MLPKNIKVAIVALAILATGSCTKDFKEINTNPTLITKEVIQPSLLFASAIRGGVFDQATHGLISDYSGYYRNPSAGNIFLERDWGNPYNSYYRNYLINLAEVMRLTSENPLLSNQNAMARIAKAMFFQKLTDCYGDLPYFDALNNVDEIVMLPKYDAQEDIYKDLLKELKEAADQLDAASTQISFGNADLLLKGNAERWRKLANSLRLRMAMRVRYANPSLAAQHITEVLSQPLITTNAENVFLATVDDGNASNNNAFYTRNLTQPNNMLVSFTLTDNLKALNDPRLPLFARPANSPIAGYRGVPLQGGVELADRYATDSVARMATSFLQPVYNIIVMNAAEVFFLRAEAALAGISSEDAQDLFASGIQAAMSQYGVAEGDIADYLVSPSGILAGAEEERLEQIIVQKWLGIYYNTYEAWAEFRRTGYPRIWTGSVLGDTEGNIPRRLTYPVAETLQNGDNVAVAIGKLSKGNTLMSKVWWDQKADLPKLHPRQGIFPPELD
ncbi:MAG TPA: SusD/RagB family nutrient-binding outer membrane lipoprotein [Flavitalea sp.]|nr:SusD/RagB family nutrient-binding outer membrane lipoprotein [Flavitalea sp.]